MASTSAFVVAVDQGIASTKAFRLTRQGEFTALCSLEHRQFYPQAGWFEHDPLELLRAVEHCLEHATGAEGVGLDNQGETVVAWSAETGEPLYNAIVWQDSRTTPMVNALRADGAESVTLAKAGLPLDPYFAATKLRWILEHVPEARALARRGKLRMGTSDSFFLDRLCGVYATDATAASRTSLMNLDTGQWDPELCRLFGVPIAALPPIRATVGEYGVLEKCGVPLVASAVDQQAALFGHGCRRPGELKITFGSGAFALAVTESPGDAMRRGGMVPTVAWRIDGRDTYALDAGVYNAVSAMNWVRSLGLFSQQRELDAFDGPSALERGLAFVPALSGLASPYWDRSAAGMWLGLDLETDRRLMVRSALEGVVLRTAQAVSAMNERVPLASSVSVDGVLANSRYFCDFLARALNRTVVVPSNVDLTGLGCALLAYMGAGLGTMEQLPPQAPPMRVIHPDQPLDPSLHARYADATSRVRRWR